MKVINPAPAADDWSIQKKCTGAGTGGGGCGATLLVEGSDLRTMKVEQPPGGRAFIADLVVFQCPCGKVSVLTTPPETAIQHAKRNGPIS